MQGASERDELSAGGNLPEKAMPEHPVHWCALYTALQWDARLFSPAKCAAASATGPDVRHMRPLGTGL